MMRYRDLIFAYLPSRTGVLRQVSAKLAFDHSFGEGGRAKKVGTTSTHKATRPDCLIVNKRVTKITVEPDQLDAQ
jgi:hypothetical protein